MISARVPRLAVISVLALAGWRSSMAGAGLGERSAAHLRTRPGPVIQGQLQARNSLTLEGPASTLFCYAGIEDNQK
jgi:hypothetical protein